MPFSTSSSVINSHKHSSAIGDGGVLDGDVSEVDTLTLDAYTMVRATTFGGG